MHNIRGKENLLTVGDVLFVIKEPERLASFEWRAGPAVLAAGRLPPARPAPPAFVSFKADWLADNRVDVPATTVGIFDQRSRALRISFGTDENRWVALADGVRMAVSASGRLVALEMDALPVDLIGMVGHA